MMALKLGLRRPRAPAGGLLGAVALGALAVAGGCKSPGEDTRECNVNADCASGTCRPDGTCEPMPQDGGAGAGGVPHGGGGAGAGGQGAGGTGATGGFGGCMPNHDGVITGEEMPLGAGYAASFRISEDVDPFDSAPDCSAGDCVWDLVDLNGTTHEEQTITESIDGKWYAQAEGFENATYVTRMADFKLGLAGLEICAQTQYGVFQVTPDALLLLGLVSEFEDGGTRLVYDPPVTVLQYPLSVGLQWTVDTVASGPLCNSLFDYHISQTYSSTVDLRGTVRTPYGDFDDVLRVNTHVERHMGVGVLPSEARTHAFVAECFTTIATVASPEGVSEPDFGQAAEVRRLSVLP